MTDYERIKREFDLSLLQKDRLMSQIYPVGSIYMSIQEVSPAALFGGVWERIENAFLLAASSAHPVGETGGEAKVTLTQAQMPKHSHAIRRMEIGSGVTDTYIFARPYESSGDNSQTSVVGGDQPHNNMPPYLSVYMWKRVG